MKKIIIATLIILGFLALISFIILPKLKRGNEIQTAFEVPNAKNEITVPVVYIDESENTHATIMTTPSPSGYTLAKDLPKYKKYIDMMEHSIVNHIPLTFTLAKIDSRTIIKITKASQKAIDYYNNMELSSELVEEVAPPTRF